MIRLIPFLFCLLFAQRETNLFAPCASMDMITPANATVGGSVLGIDYTTASGNGTTIPSIIVKLH